MEALGIMGFIFGLAALGISSTGCSRDLQLEIAQRTSGFTTFKNWFL